MQQTQKFQVRSRLGFSLDGYDWAAGNRNSLKVENHITFQCARCNQRANLNTMGFVLHIVKLALSFRLDASVAAVTTLMTASWREGSSLLLLIIDREWPRLIHASREYRLSQ